MNIKKHKSATEKKQCKGKEQDAWPATVVAWMRLEFHGEKKCSGGPVPGTTSQGQEKHYILSFMSSKDTHTLAIGFW